VRIGKKKVRMGMKKVRMNKKKVRVKLIKNLLGQKNDNGLKKFQKKNAKNKYLYQKPSRIPHYDFVP